MNYSNDDRRETYGYSKLTHSDSLMTMYMVSGKKQIVFWAESVKNCEKRFMTYDTFKTRLRDYLRRTKQTLSGSQIDRIRLLDHDVKRYAQLYIQEVSSIPMTKASFFEQFIIVPPYNTVPSYEQFKVKLIRQLQLEGRSVPIVLTDQHDNNNAVLGQQATKAETEEQMMETTNCEHNHGLLSLEADFDLDLAVRNSLNYCANQLVKAKATRIEVSPRVTNVYRCIRLATGELGGNGSGGPIYGELTAGSMQRIVNYLVAHGSFGPSSRFVDIGAGLGKPNLHVAQNPGVHLSIGVEVEQTRWEVRFL